MLKLFIGFSITFCPGLQQAWAQWPTTPYTSDGAFGSFGYYDNLFSFNDGSTIVVGVLEDDIYLRKIDAFGYGVWPDPILVHHNDSSDMSSAPGIITDGDNGCILIWGDHRNSVKDAWGYLTNGLYIQRIDRDGQKQWGDGIEVTTGQQGNNGGLFCSDGAGGILIARIERDFHRSGARNIEVRHIARYSANGIKLWDIPVDTSNSENTFFFWNIARIQSRIFLSAWPNNVVFDTNGNITKDTPIPQNVYVSTENDSLLLVGLMGTVTDTNTNGVFTNYTFTKLTADYDTIWTAVVPILKDGEYNTHNNNPLISDGRGGAYFINSTYTDLSNRQTRVYHIDSMGINLWPPNTAHLINFSTIAAYSDREGGILIVNTEYSDIMKYSYDGYSAWDSIPTRILSDYSNAYSKTSVSDFNGGVIIGYWRTSGGIWLHHSGRYGQIGIITTVQYDHLRPRGYSLSQNYPNPFNPNTTIEVSIPTSSSINLAVFNLLGQNIAILASDRYPAGIYQFSWSPRLLPTGIYYYRLTTDDNVFIKKLVYAK